MEYLAHIDGDREQSVKEHLQGTAELAEKFAAKFRKADWGYCCGMLHDIGKYSAEFQKKIKENLDIRVDHSTAGAKVCENLDGCYWLLTYCIAGHHAGLPDLGREVLRSAAEYLTPVTLELGGKSPCIVDATAKIPLAARRIVFGKYLNCGQTCVAPDHILCDGQIRDQLVEAIREEIARQFGENPLQNPDYGKIINEKHFHRLLGLMDAEKTVCGGQYDEKTLRIAPTVMTDVDWADAVMGEEIFGPILPVLTYNAHDAEKGVAQNDFCRDASGTHAATGDFVDWAIRCVEEHPHPLALYFFSEDKKAQRRILNYCHFGGGCINDTIIHLATSAMPFGGVGESGMGGYHGRTGFETFSHYRSIVDKKTWMDLPIRYQRYDEKKEKLLRRFLK
jgi:CRISPR-associated endonuclease Cas3-HD